MRQINPALAKESAQSGVGGVKDVLQMSVSYAKQETLEPLKSAGRYAAFGLAAAMFIGTGLVLVMLGALRGIQLVTGATDDKRGGLDGSWSWAPYLLTFVVCLLVIGAIFAAMRRSLRTGGSAQ